jgi:hypothetical protein
MGSRARMRHHLSQKQAVTPRAGRAGLHGLPARSPARILASSLGLHRACWPAGGARTVYGGSRGRDLQPGGHQGPEEALRRRAPERSRSLLSEASPRSLLADLEVPWGREVGGSIDET